MKRFLHLGFAICLQKFCFAQQFKHTEMVFRVSDHTATIQFFLAVPQEVCIVYGTQPANYPNQTPWILAQPDVGQAIILDGLAANTRYYYRLQYRDLQSNIFLQRPEHSFHTQLIVGEALPSIVQAYPPLPAPFDLHFYTLSFQN